MLHAVGCSGVLGVLGHAHEGGGTGISPDPVNRLPLQHPVRVIEVQNACCDFPNVQQWDDRDTVQRKSSTHWSMRGLKNRLKVPVRRTMDSTSLPFARLQKAQAYTRFSATVGPPSFSLMKWSTSQPKKVSSSYSKQYSQRYSARSATS